MLLTIVIIAVLVAVWIAYEITHAYEEEDYFPVNQQEDEDTHHTEMIVDNNGHLFEIDNNHTHLGYETGTYPA